jgi:hypothetical protein
MLLRQQLLHQAAEGLLIVLTFFIPLGRSFIDIHCYRTPKEYRAASIFKDSRTGFVHPYAREIENDIE